MTDRPETLPLNTPMIHLIYNAPALLTPKNAETIERLIAADDPSSRTEVQLNWEIQTTEKCLGTIRWGEHTIRISGLPYPLPQAVVDRTIHTSHWAPQVKAALRQHQSHLSLVYLGTDPDPIEKMIALYRAAHSLANETLLGVVNEPAWTAHPVADFLDPVQINTYRQELPFMLWVGYVKFFVDKQHYWLTTRGHHIFDVPDFAYFVQPDDDPDAIINQFINLFYYLFEEDVVVAAGDTLEISGAAQFLRLGEVPKEANFLMGPSGTLVIENISADEANP